MSERPICTECGKPIVGYGFGSNPTGWRHMPEECPPDVPAEPDYKMLAELWQANPVLHPWTCNGGNPDFNTHHTGEVRLVPMEGRFECPRCGRVQPYDEWTKQMLTIMSVTERIRNPNG